MLPSSSDDDAGERSPPAGPAPPTRGRVAIFAYRAVGSLALVLATAGIVLPGLPATPFLLVAVWAFARGAPHLVVAIEKDRRFGPILVNWRERRAVPRRAKALAVLSMSASFAILAFSGASAAMLWLVGAILVAVATYLLTRPAA